MIPTAFLQAWSAKAPWPDLRQVEQDLIIRRALYDLFGAPTLKGKIAFRGGTAIHKLLFKLMLDAVPSDPERDDHRQGDTFRTADGRWRRAKAGRRFRFHFRYESEAKVIAFAWVYDERTLRSTNRKSERYAVFQNLPGRRNPPDSWAALVAATRTDWSTSENRQ